MEIPTNELETELFDAIYDRNFQEVCALVQKGVNLDCTVNTLLVFGGNRA